MNGRQQYEAGRLGEALADAMSGVKSRPTDTAQRTFLFELFCFAGELDRAEKQLDAIAQLDAQSEWAVQVYRNLLHAERARRKLFEAGQKPEFLLDPPPHVGRTLDAINRLRENDGPAAAAALDDAEGSLPSISGTFNGESFDELRDCDDVTAGVLEIMILRDYAWVAWEQVRVLEIAQPERPRDLIWAPAKLTTVDNQQRSVYLPVLYHRSYQHEHDQVKLGRSTDWKAVENGPTLGYGMHTWLAGDQAAALMECRRLELNAS